MSVGKMSPDDIRKLLNKTAGQQISHNLNKDNPTNVKEWIPTGSRWLDSIVCRGSLAGIPVGKVTEIAGLESTGKSYMAAQVAANAQKMGIQVVYFDSESALDSSFLERSGCNVDDIVAETWSVQFSLTPLGSFVDGEIASGRQASAVGDVRQD